VKLGSISWDPSSLTLQFAIGPIPAAKNAAAAGSANVQPVAQEAVVSAAQFNVVCRGQPKPDMFAENRDVIVEGHLGPANQIEADQVLTSCPSKYDPKGSQASDPKGSEAANTQPYPKSVQ
jgi:hypothetical protein